MRDWDWLNAMYLGAYGFALGPLLGFGIYRLSQYRLPWQVPLGFVIEPVGAVIFGTIAGSIIGFLWGLLGEQIRDSLFEASTFFAKRFRHHSKRQTAEFEDEVEAVQSAEPDRVRIVESQMSVLRTIPLAGDEDDGLLGGESPQAAETVSSVAEPQSPVMDVLPSVAEAASSEEESPPQDQALGP